MSKQSEIFEPPVPRRVFEDKTGRRLRLITVLVTLGTIVALGFAGEFAYRVYSLKPPLLSSPVFDPFSAADTPVAPGADTTSVVMKESAYTDCGQGLFEFTKNRPGLAGYVPFNDATALAGLRAHCRELSSVYYQAFSFGTLDGGITPLSDAGAGFPLPEFNTGFISRNRPRGFPILAPETGISTARLEQIFSTSMARDTFLAQLAALDTSGVDGGFCLDLTSHPDMPSTTLAALYAALNSWLQPSGLASCLIGDIDAAFWADPVLVDLVQQPVLLGVQNTSSPAAPIAPQTWFEEAVALAQSQVAPGKLSVALGSFSTMWKSGQRFPERIPFSEAMLRANFAEGLLRFSADTGNTNARYLDENRRLNQIWVLDAASFHNQRRLLGEAPEITLWPLGYEDPAIWQLSTAESPKAALELEIDLSEHVTVEGSGPFSTHIAEAVPGQRQVKISSETGLITALDYIEIPSPRRIRLFGGSADLALALSFNGLGNSQQTQKLLALLESYAISATFFLSTSDLLLSKSRVEQIMAAGHSVGTQTRPRESRAAIWGVFSTIQNNLSQQLLQDELSHHALLVQNPSRYGQFPGDGAVLDQLQDLQTSGYLPVFSNLPAPYGAFAPHQFVHIVRDIALDAPASVLSFDFSEQNDNALNDVLPEILHQLEQDGFTFTTLPNAAGLTPAQVFPRSGNVPVFRDQVIYWLMTVTWIGVQNFVFLLALIVALRSPIYLALAFIRREKFAYDANFHPPVTIIIPAFNEAKVIQKTLESVLASDYPDLRVIVVDDGSSDRTRDVVSSIAQTDGRIELIEQDNHGKWFAEDQALNNVETPIFVIVDADTLLHQDAIKHLVQPFRDKTVGAVAGTVEIGNRDNVITACQAIEYKISQSVMRRAYEVFNGILVVPGAIGAWRKDAVFASGLVSGDTITEDADLTVALHRSRFKVVYAPLARSYTEAPNSVSAFMQQRLRWSLGMLQVAWKHKGAIIEGRPVGFISILDAVWYRIVSSFVYPLVDIIVLSTVATWGYRIATQGSLGLTDLSISVIILFFALTFLDVINLAAAFWFERRFEWKLLFLVPFLRFGYRQLLYISSMRSIIHALSGRLRGWQKLKRTDTAQIIND